MRLLLCAATVLCTMAASSPPPEGSEAAFHKFRGDFGKNYANPSEEEYRFGIFSQNYAYILAANSKNQSYTLGVNQFTDMTHEEFVAGHLGLRTSSRAFGGARHLGTHEYSGWPLADAFDWRTKGAVTPVKDQGSCGSCWSFSSTGAFEGAWQIATGKLVSMSEQQLMDCSVKFDNHGCDGGEPDNSFQFSESNVLCTEQSYPYEGSDNICRPSKCTEAVPQGKISGYKDVAHSAEALMEAVMQQPVAIGIEADTKSFQHYASGVYGSDDCGEMVDHAVLVVGYGMDGQDYWQVKNSWGESWGEQGYFRLLRGKGGVGECGILKQPSYPVVAGAPGPSPPSPPPGPSTFHYGKPPCRSDESVITVSGVSGNVCAPACSGQSCPTDVPPATSAQPECILSSSSGSKSCGLSCLGDYQCPEGATCESIEPPFPINACIYTQSGEKSSPVLFA